MIAHVSATASRPPRELTEPTGDHEFRAPGWAARLVRICLAIYLIPVLLVMLLVGGIGVVVLGVAGVGVKLAALVRGASRARKNGFPL